MLSRNVSLVPSLLWYRFSMRTASSNPSNSSNSSNSRFNQSKRSFDRPASRSGERPEYNKPRFRQVERSEERDTDRSPKKMTRFERRRLQFAEADTYSTQQSHQSKEGFNEKFRDQPKKTFRASAEQYSDRSRDSKPFAKPAQDFKSNNSSFQAEKPIATSSAKAPTGFQVNMAEFTHLKIQQSDSNTVFSSEFASNFKDAASQSLPDAKQTIKQQPYVLQNHADYCLVFKPTGWAMHTHERDEQTLSDWLHTKFAPIPKLGDAAELESETPAKSSVAAVHRIDRYTSGAVLCAKNPRTARFLTADFQDKRVYKEYLAIVAGCVDFPSNSKINADILIANSHTKTHETLQHVPRNTDIKFLQSQQPVADTNAPEFPSFLIDIPLRKSIAPVTYSMVAKPNPSNIAQSWVRVLGHNQSKTHTLVSVSPLAGKTHQIRAHLAMIGHPILNDSLYERVSGIERRKALARNELNIEPRDDSSVEAEREADRQMLSSIRPQQYYLHAWRMDFPDPSHQKSTDPDSESASDQNTDQSKEQTRSRRVSIDAPTPSDFTAALLSLKFDVFDTARSLDRVLRRWRDEPVLFDYISRFGSNRQLKQLLKERKIQQTKL